MAQLIDKDALVAEIDKRLHQLTDAAFDSMIGRNLIEIKDFIDTIEVKEEDSWHLQSKEDIYDSFNDWGLHDYVCLMKDGTVQKFTGYYDECLDGSINLHMNCDNDEYH